MSTMDDPADKDGDLDRGFPFPASERRPHGEPPPPLPDHEIPFQLGLDGEIVDWPTADEAAVSIVAEGVQLAPPAPRGDSEAGRTSLRSRLARAAEQPRFDANGYAAYRHRIEEAEVEIIHRQRPPELPKSAETADLPARLLRALEGEDDKSD